MPFKYISELPDSVKNNLPKHAQEIYMKAYNSALVEYADKDKRMPNSSLEETAAKVAWDAVKHIYKRDTKGQWVERQPL